MPLCPQITNTPITVTQTADFTVTSVTPLIGNTYDGLANNIESIEILADGKTKVYRSATEPTGAGINDGDLWIDTDDGNKLYVRASGAWTSAQDTSIATAQAAATAASAAAASAAAAAGAAQSTANTALADAATAYTAAIGSLQPSANTIVNASNQITAINGTGITIYSGASSTTGSRIVLNSLGLAAYGPGTSYSVTNAVGNGTTVTYTASGHNFTVGSTVTVSELAPAGYNGTFLITAVVSGSTFTVSNTTTATVTDSSGIAYGPGRSVNITNAVGNGSTVTYTASGHGYSVGTSVTVSGLAPDGYNGTFLITSVVAGSTFTVSNGTTATLTDSSGVAQTATLAISATTGNAVFQGSITGSTIIGGTLNIAGKAIIDSTGLLTATGATITGTINAEAGYFGTPTNGFSISSTGLVGVGTGTIVGGAISGTTFTNGSTFSVTSAGVLTATSGFNFIAQAQAMMDERQVSTDGRNFVLSTRDNFKFAQDLAGRQTLQGRPASVWESGQIGQNVASFDVYTGAYLQNQVGGADPATTVTANQSFKPEGGTVSATGVVTNVDCRTATIPVTASAAYNIGDKVTFANGGTTVKALGLMDKTDTGQAMTFTIVAKPSGTSVTVYPKPIAVDDPALSALEKAYANINTRILNAATMNRINIDANALPSIFFSRDAVEVFTGEIDARMFGDLGGKKVISSRMKSGQTVYMIYDANPTTMELSYRLFTWYGITIKNPMACGVAISF